MRLAPSIYLVGSGAFGFGMSSDYDCHVYALVDHGDIALIDSGCGLGHGQIEANLIADGLDPSAVRQVFLTHYHGDHAGGASAWRHTHNARVFASRDTARALRQGDEEATGLRVARTAGIYPSDYHLTPCAVDDEVAEGEHLDVGKLVFQVLETPGHCFGHIALYGQVDNRYCLFSGDSVFYGGRVLVQNLPDCLLPEYCDTILRLEELVVDALLPGHLMLSLRNGHRHLARAAEAVRMLRIPPNAVE